MNPWIIIALVGAGIIFLIDYLARRKSWKNNTKAEKISLLLNMISAPIYVFMTALGMLWGITGSGADTAFGETLYDITLAMMWLIGILSIVAVIGSIVLRKKEKVKASIWINVIALGYIIVVFAVNGISGLM